VPVRAIVFDLFDTLVDLLWENLPTQEHHGARLPSSVANLFEAVSSRSDVSFEDFTQALVEGARGFAESHFKQDREVSTLLRFEDLARRLRVDDPELPGLLTAVHMGALRAQVRVLPHHPEVLATLRERVTLGLCSNFSHSDTALGVLEDASLRSAFDALVVSDAVGIRKPRREIFDAVLDALDVAPEEVLHVGDSLRADVGGASPLGIRTVWITRRVSDRAQALGKHEGPPPDHEIADLRELPALLDALG
jgi:HAD superfamily hydrolase (TIGR01493 family)